MLHIQNFVHPFETEPSLAVQEVGNVGLLEASLLRETQPGEFSGINPARGAGMTPTPFRFDVVTLRVKKINSRGGDADRALFLLRFRAEATGKVT